MTSGNRAEGGEMQPFSHGSSGAAFEPPHLTPQGFTPPGQDQVPKTFSPQPPQAGSVQQLTVLSRLWFHLCL